jgi:hypothetical protein
MSARPIKNPGLAATSGPGYKNNVSANHTLPRPALKWVRVLRALFAGQSLHRFEAERPPISDHCLHSTISELEAKGVQIERKAETVTGYMGEPAHVKRYWLAPEAHQRAAELLGVDPDSPAGLQLQGAT